MFIAGWTLVILASAWLNYANWRAHQLEMAEKSAAAFVGQVMLTRYWNAYHQRVYVPVTKATLPNPYLQVPRRDIVGSDGTVLTMVNPSFMTRQISEMTDSRSYVRFHLTSNRPLRPGNEPTPVEARALERFEVDPTPVSHVLDSPDGELFFYMEPVFTEAPCLSCHQQHGYRIGDVRGGISVTTTLMSSSIPTVVTASHAGLLGVGILGILGFFNRLRSNINVVKYHASRDPLTGLLNRREIEALLEREIQRSQRSKHPLCLMLVDFDDFKRINDRYGHAVGDRALRELADLIRLHTRCGYDAVGRFGGDEFIVLMAETPEDRGVATAERVRMAVEQHRVDGPDGVRLGITVSIGLVQGGQSECNGENLFARADQALYQVKESGKNRVYVA